MPTFRNELRLNDSEIALALAGEERRQQDGVELIPSENYTYPEVLELLGSVFTNKYSEGYPGRRYYGGQQFTDQIESLARQRACSLFRAAHANVQPLSGSPMNQAAYLGLLRPGDTILAMDLSHGGHLTHGAPVSHMGRLFNFVRYKTLPSKGGAVDFDELRAIAREARPKLVLCGYSSYPRELDYAAFKSIADEVGALTMADVSHYGGLIAANVMRNPLDAGFDVMTTTSHKTLRGPRGGIILCRREHAGRIDASVFPGLQGGPHMNVVAGTAVTLKKAATSDFSGILMASVTEREGPGRSVDGTRDEADHGRDRQSHDGCRHRDERRIGRRRGRGHSRFSRHHREQADPSRRSSSAVQTKRHSPRYTGGNHPRDGRTRNATYCGVHCCVSPRDGGCSGSRAP